MGILNALLRDLGGSSTLAGEFIQNADDADGCTRLCFDVRDHALVISNDSVFRPIDFQRIRRIASGGKRQEAGTTGAFGIGFLSAYQITDRPRLLSAEQQWEFRPEAGDIEVVKPVPTRGTTFILPWAREASDVRRALGMAPIAAPSVESWVQDLARYLPTAALFLKRLQHLEIAHQGRLVLGVDRLSSDDALLISDGDQITRWLIIRGNFDAEATSLRERYGTLIENESKRHSQVTVAIPEGGAIEGRLYAVLPTDYPTGLPFHVNADFYPTMDRKSVIFEDDYQSQWNRAAINAAARAIAAATGRLESDLSPEIFWSLADQAYQNRRDAVVGTFWSHLEPVLREQACVLTTQGDLKRPAEMIELPSPEYEGGAPALQALGLPTVDGRLRPFHNVLAAVGTTMLNMNVLCRTMREKGFTEERTITDLPLLADPEEFLPSLWAVADLLLGTSAETRGNGQLLAQCAIFPTVDHRLVRAVDLFRSTDDAEEAFGALRGVRFLDAGDLPQRLANLAPVLTVEHAIDQLAHADPQDLAQWRGSGRWSPQATYEWFSSRQRELVAAPALAERFQLLPIFPSGEELRPLRELALPGDFTDPLSLAGLVDVAELGGRTDLLRALGAQPLTLALYASRFVPAAFALGNPPGPKQRRELVALLARRLGDLRDDALARQGLADCPLVDCGHHGFRTAAQAYRDSPSVRDLLGAEAAIAASAQSHAQATIEFYRWLDIPDQPRLDDLARRVLALARTGKPSTAKSDIAAIMRHVGGRWAHLTDTQRALILRPLSSVAWVPARGDPTVWHRPSDVYLEYQRDLFASQARFVDLPLSVQQSAAGLLQALGMKPSPEIALVVNHLLQCVRENLPASLEIYRHLSLQTDEAAINRLRGTRCLFIDGGYIEPHHCFWADHPFGSYRTKLAGQMYAFRALLDRLGARENPSWRDAVDVLCDISAQYGEFNRPLDEEPLAVALACWRLLSQALHQGEVDAEDLAGTFAGRKVVPDRRHVLATPASTFFEDRPGLAERFTELAHNIIERTPDAWRAMEAAGVTPLSQAARVHLVECHGARSDQALTLRIRERVQHLQRVVEVTPVAALQRRQLARFAEMRVVICDTLTVQYSAMAFGRTFFTAPADSDAQLDADDNILYVVRHDQRLPWVHIASELAYFVEPSPGAQLLTPAFRDALSADNPIDALDELGFPRIASVVSPPPVGPSATTLGVPSGSQGTPDEPRNTDLTTSAQPRTSSESSPRKPSDDSKQGEEAPTGAGPAAPNADGARTPRDDGAADSNRGHTGAREGSAPRTRLRSYVVANGAPRGSISNEGAVQLGDAGVEAACAYERRHGRDPEVMGQTFPGYDITSRGPEPHGERYIEVKAVDGEWDELGVGLSHTQFETARKLGEQFWLYVVERANSANPRVIPIQNPAWQIEQYMFDAGWEAVAAVSEETPST